MTAPGDDPRLHAQKRLEAMVGRGELTLAEFSDHAAAIWSATCPAELDVALSDLPTPAPVDPARRPFDDPTAPAAGTAPAPAGPGRAPVTYAPGEDGVATSFLGSTLKREGRWDLTNGFRGRAILDDVFLDLREAVVDAPRTSIHVDVYGGSLRVLLPPGVTVTVGGTQVLADLKVDDTHYTGGGGPHIDLRANVWLGDVKVKYLPAGEPVPKMWKWF